MKFNININQLALSEISPEMGIIDAAILDYIIVICKSSSDKIDTKRHLDKDGVSWTWVDFGQLLTEMPLLQIKSTGAITPRIRQIEKNGYITTLRKRIDGHVCLFIRLNGLVDRLFMKVNSPIHGDEQVTQKPIHIREPIIDTSNTIHPYTRTLGDFDRFWEAYPIKKARKVAESIWFRKIKPELADSIIGDVLHRKVTDRQWLEGYIPHASTYLNQERWNDEITPQRGNSPNLPLGTPHLQEKYNKGKEILA